MIKPATVGESFHGRMEEMTSSGDGWVGYREERTDDPWMKTSNSVKREDFSRPRPLPPKASDLGNDLRIDFGDEVVVKEGVWL